MPLGSRIHLAEWYFVYISYLYSYNVHVYIYIYPFDAQDQEVEVEGTRNQVRMDGRLCVLHLSTHIFIFSSSSLIFLHFYRTMNGKPFVEIGGFCIPLDGSTIGTTAAVATTKRTMASYRNSIFSHHYGFFYGTQWIRV